MADEDEECPQLSTQDFLQNSSIPLSTVVQSIRGDSSSKGELMAASMNEGLRDRDLSSHEGLASTEAETTMGQDPSKRGNSAGMYGDVETGGPEHHPPGQQRSNAPELSLLRKPSNHKPVHGWTPDRGPGYYHAARERRHRAALVDTGENAGMSRVVYTNRELMFVHSWLKDSFISALNTPMKYLATAVTIIYILSFFFFAGLWWALHVGNPDCVYGINGFAMAYNFSLVTQQTIGYGNSGPNDCYIAAFLISCQTMTGLFLDSITLGIIFARISLPKNRGRTIGISDSSIISRRDGILKFMFRIADFRDTQVVEPAVKCFMYTWGKGRTTAEGEHIPVRIEQMEIHHIDGMLLLPIIIEHTVDERSPLCGHTFDSLTEVDAEIIVTFEGTTEMGNPFMARQSYLPTEIHWGHKFSSIIRRPKPPSTRFVIEIEKFHDVEPMPGLEMMPPGPLSRLVVSKAVRTVPYPLLGENTLVLSDSLVVANDENGDLALMFRVGDTYPTQHLDVQLKMYLYRWKPKRAADCGKPDDVQISMLEVGYESGNDRALLWLPWMAKHVINEDSPLHTWLTPSGFMGDADSCIALVAEAYQYLSGQNRFRMRVYNVLEDVKRQHAFEPIITSPTDSPDYKPRVDWVRFHSTRPLPGAAEHRRAAMPQMRISDSTLAVSTYKTPRRESVALSKISFVPHHNAPPIAHHSRPPSGDRRHTNGEERLPPPTQETHEVDDHRGEDGHAEPNEGAFLPGHSSNPPESSGTLLTPWNDPENTFIQRPIPPIAEGDEEHYTGTSSLTVSSLGALARSSAQSLKKAFSRDMDR